MIHALLVANDLLLFLCTSMYLGTGWSLVLFQFPLRSQITVDNYHLPFVAPVILATRFFTWMTAVMILTALVMIVGVGRTALVLAPVIVLLGVAAATLLTVILILPLNARMADGIRDPAELNRVLDRWMRLNVVRVGLWSVQWAAMAAYFGIRVS